MKLDSQNQDMLNYMLGQYIAVGVNNPKQFPKSPFLQKVDSAEKLQPMTDEEMAAAARRSAAQWKELTNGRKQHDD